MNELNSPRYRELDRQNLNKPLAEIVCPRCESREIQQDREMTDHPGIFECRACWHSFCA